MAVKFNLILDVASIPDESWSEWYDMGYERDPLEYLKKEYGVTEVAYRFRKNKIFREVRFRSRRKYMEFCLRWM